MKKKGKKLIALFLWLSLMAMAEDVWAKKRGVELHIVKTDRQRLRGELIAVKENLLFVSLSESSPPLSIDVRDIQNMSIEKKSYMFEGAIIGVLIGGVVGGKIGLELMRDGGNGSYEVVGCGAVGIGLGLIIGQTAGLALGKEKMIHVEEMAEPEVKKLLKKLRSKARFPEYE